MIGGTGSRGAILPALALAALCQSYHGVICSDTAHVETDECGAPEFFSNGSKLLVAPSPDGKLTPDAIRAIATNRKDIHFPKPRVVTITHERTHASGASGSGMVSSRQISHSPANASGSPSRRCTRYG